MKYIESPGNEAFFNMALEEYVFESLPKEQEYFMLWQNRNAVVVGRYQDTLAETHADYVRENGVEVVRRLSGGGAMYQDLGNLNFTFVVDQKSERDLNFTLFMDPVVRTLQSLGADAERSSRNDILVDGMKVSGNAQYNRHGRTMHHGTLLFDAKLDTVALALNVAAEKLESKGVRSVRSRVTNILPHLKQPIGIAQFKEALLYEVFGSERVDRVELSARDLAAVTALRDAKYATWQWNYGNSPRYRNRHTRRFPFGLVTVGVEAQRGKIQEISVTGDFFGNGELAELEQRLTGCKLEQAALAARLDGFPVEHYIQGMTAALLLDLLLQSSETVE